MNAQKKDKMEKEIQSFKLNKTILVLLPEKEKSNQKVAVIYDKNKTIVGYVNGINNQYYLHSAEGKFLSQTNRYHNNLYQMVISMENELIKQAKKEKRMERLKSILYKDKSRKLDR